MTPETPAQAGGERDPIGRPIDFAKRYRFLLTAHAELTAAAMKVCDDMDKIHDTKPYPLKYGAPFGAIAELRILLNKQLGLRHAPATFNPASQFESGPQIDETDPAALQAIGVSVGGENG